MTFKQVNRLVGSEHVNDAGIPLAKVRLLRSSDAPLHKVNALRNVHELDDAGRVAGQIDEVVFGPLLGGVEHRDVRGARTEVLAPVGDACLQA